MNDWSFHIKHRDNFRLMALFAANQDLSKRYELMAHIHGGLARRALECRR